MQQLLQSPNIETNAAMSGQQSPKLVYTIFVLSLFKEFVSEIGSLDVEAIDRKCTALVAFVPDKEVRERLWQEYQARRQDGNVVSASILTTGDLVSYFAGILEWEESATGAWL